MPRPTKPQPWSPEIEEHLRGFVSSFVAVRFRPRWQHILLEKPEKASTELHRFEHQYDDRTCKEIDSAVWESLLDGELAGTRGVYFDGRGNPEFLTGADVSARLSPYPDDAIFSVLPGAKALFISHDGDGWLCVR